MKALTIDRSMPAKPEAERQILAAIIFDQRDPNACLMQAQARVTPDDFSLDSNRRLYRAMQDLASEGKPIEYTTLGDKLLEKGELEAVGVSYLTNLGDGMPRIQNIDAYIDIVLKASKQRQIININSAAVQRAYELEDPEEIAGAIQESLALITQRSQQEACTPASAIVQGLGQRLMKQFDGGARFIGLPTPIGRLNYALGGLVRKENIVVAADTGGGKTSLALNTTELNCKNDKPVHWFSVEMSKEALLLRLAASLTGINYMKIRNTGNLHQSELTAVLEALSEIGRWPLWIDDTSDLSTRQMYARGRMQAARGARLIVVDYLQRVRAAGNTTVDQISAASGCVAGMAKDGDVPVLNLSQLSRFEKTSKDSQLRKPNMHDLKGSGNIEQDADSVVLLWREQIREDNGDRLIYTGNDSMIIGKNRNGPCFEIAVRYDGEVMVWREKDADRDLYDGKMEAARA
jgi:replicative DNA helicase